jgi:small GTP-binding protein
MIPRNPTSAPSFKVCIYGQESVGKTCILNRRISSSFSQEYRPTIAAAHASLVEMVKDKSVLLNIWDTAGQEKYHKMMPLYFRNSRLVLLVADATNPSSWSYVRKWVDEELQSLHPVPGVIACINKCDEPDAPEIHHFLEWIEGQNIPLLRTSAFSGFNIPELFQRIAEELLDSQIQQPLEEPMPPEKSKSGGCC